MKSEIFTLCSPRLSEGYLLMKYALKRAAAGLATILIVSFLTFAAFSLTVSYTHLTLPTKLEV